MEYETLLNIEEALRYPEVRSRVAKKSDELFLDLYDVTTFEYECYADIGKNIKSRRNHDSIANLANYHVRRKAAKYLRKRRKEKEDHYIETVESLEKLSADDGEGNTIEFQIKDVLANVESEILAKEIVALLAQDDRRKQILEAWKIGNEEPTSISRMLAHTIDGKEETHRKFISRFKKECREHLSAVI